MFSKGKRHTWYNRWWERHGGLCLWLRGHLLTILTMLSVVIGCGIGFLLRLCSTEPWSPRSVMYISFPGEVYLRVLRCLILPLIVSSLISSVGKMDVSLSGKIASKAILYYLTTTPCAVILGIVLTTAIHPGQYTTSITSMVQTQPQQTNTYPGTTIDNILDLFRNFLTDNLVASCFEQFQTVLIPPSNSNYTNYGTASKLNGTSSNETRPVQEVPISSYTIVASTSANINVLGLITFCITLGICIRRLREKGRPLLCFFTSLFECMMEIIRLFIWLSPIGIGFMMCGNVIQIKNFSQMLGQIGLYFITVFLGLFIHGFLVIPLIYFVITRSSPYHFIWNQAEALVTAFATSSSTATMPVSIRCLEDCNNVHSQVARFVLPVGIINMEGTALYEAVGALFIAQINGFEMTTGEVILLSVTATAASMGAAGIPQAGLVTMVLVLNSVGLPVADVSLLVMVDFILDRLRTLVNVLSDSVGAGIVNHLSKPDLERWESLSSITNDYYPQYEDCSSEKSNLEKSKSKREDLSVNVLAII